MDIFFKESGRVLKKSGTLLLFMSLIKIETIIKLASKYKFYFLDEVLADLYLQADSITLNVSKTIKAHERILEKYDDVWKLFPKVKEYHLNAIGTIKSQKGIYNGEAFRKAYMVSKNPVFIVKMFLAKCGVLKYLRR